MKLVPYWSAGRIVCAVLMVLTFIAIVEIYRKIQFTQASLDWPSTMGVVRSYPSDYESPHEIIRTEGVIRYEYTVNGTAYVGSLFDNSLRTRWRKPESDLLKKRYPVGSPIRVFFDPMDPSLSVIEPGGHIELMWALLFLEAGLNGLFFWGLFGRPHELPLSDQRPPPREHASPEINESRSASRGDE